MPPYTFQVNMNSVERMVEYTAYDPEAPAIIPERRPLPGWPFEVSAFCRGAAGLPPTTQRCPQRWTAPARCLGFHWHSAMAQPDSQSGGGQVLMPAAYAGSALPRCARCERLELHAADALSCARCACCVCLSCLQGAIEVQQLVVRYRADLDPVLKGISFAVRGREKASAPIGLCFCNVQPLSGIRGALVTALVGWVLERAASCGAGLWQAEQQPMLPLAHQLSCPTP